MSIASSSFAADTGKDLKTESVIEGMSKSRLDQMSQLFQDYTQNKEYAGIIFLVQRNGKIVDFRAHGYRDLEKKLPMEKDTIVPIYSMTKLVTSVAVLQLMEDGKIILDDPVGNYLPEFKDPRTILKGDQFVKAKKKLTVRHLLTHTAGYTYSFGGKRLLDRLYVQANLWNSKSLQEFASRVSKLPLLHEPGEKFSYGINVDILGYLVEKVSGMALEDYFITHIFAPLEMSDTFFQIPAEKAKRIAKVYYSDHGKPLAENRQLSKMLPLGHTPWGGAGLYSTAVDFVKFAQMLLDQGRFKNYQILSPKTVQMMTSNHLEGLTGHRFHSSIDDAPYSQGKGFGLGVEVHLETGLSGIPLSKGQFGWYGAGTTYCQMDPQEKMVTILLAPYFPQNRNSIFERFAAMANSALVTPSR